MTRWRRAAVGAGRMVVLAGVAFAVLRVEALVPPDVQHYMHIAAYVALIVLAAGRAQRWLVGWLVDWLAARTAEREDFR